MAPAEARAGQREPLMFAPGRDGQGNDQAQDEEWFDQHERTSPEGHELKDIAHTVESVAHQPQGLTCQARDEAQSYDVVGGLLRRRIVLEHGGNPVRDGAAQAEEDDGDEATPDVVVERCDLRHKNATDS